MRSSRLRLSGLRVTRHWIVWSIVLFVVTIALGFVAHAVPSLQVPGLDAAINKVNSPLFDQLALLADQLDRPTVVAVILVIVFIVLLFVEGWLLALGTTLVTGLGWLTTIVVKTIVAQPRPSVESLTHLLHVNPATLSYPSGHVVFATALTAALVMSCRSRAAAAVVGIVGAVVVLIVAWSRLYVGVHYVTDVIGGVLNGLAGVILFAGLWNLLTRRFARR